MISKETIDKIFETARIEEVVGDFVNLKRAGSNLKGLSPFTNERTPSFFVSPAKQIFKCFSSGKGGSAVTFLMEHEKLTYPEALRFLAKKYNIEIEEKDQSPEQKEAASERESLYLINEFAAQFFADALLNLDEGKTIGYSYFKERGITDESIASFKLGYSPRQRDALLQAARKKGYTDELIQKSGLANLEGSPVDRFRERVIFPIYSQSGRVLGFGGRIMRSDVKAPKYLNSPETPIYHKSKTLYGLYQSRQHIVKEDRCYLVEGYTDVISMHQSGVKNVVASSGTSLTEGQIRMIKRLTPNVTILYDGDPAGIKASFRGIDMILEEGLAVKVLLFPEGEDPDSFARSHSGDEIRDYIRDNETDFIRFKAKVLLKETGNDPLKRAAAYREIVSSIAHIPDPLMRDVYLREAARLLDVDEKVLASELTILMNKLAKEKSRSAYAAPPEMDEAALRKVSDAEAAETHKTVQTQKHFYVERDLVKMLLLHGHKNLEMPVTSEEGEEEVTQEFRVDQVVLNLIFEEEEELFHKLQHPFLNTIFEQYTEALEKNLPLPETNDLVRHANPEVASLVSDLLTEKHQLANWEKREIYVSDPDTRLHRLVLETVARFKEVKLGDMLNQTAETLKKTEAEEALDIQEGVLKEIMEIQKIRSQLNAYLNRIL